MADGQPNTPPSPSMLNPQIGTPGAIPPDAAPEVVAVPKLPEEPSKVPAEASLPQPSMASTEMGLAAQRQVVVRAQNVKKVYRMGRAEPQKGRTFTQRVGDIFSKKKAAETTVEEVHALRGVDMEIFSGEYLSIMGPSGSGKSTFFNMIGGLDKPTAGKVFIDEVDIAALDAYELAWLRCRKIGYIFQSFNIIPVMTALENVTLPMVFAGLSSDEARDKGVELLRLVGLGERVNHKPYELSGGQQQRVAIARSMANDPAIILADEPTGNLDLKTGAEIIELLTRLKDERGVTIISATHDHKMLKKSDRIVWVRDGRIDKIELRENLNIQEGTIGGETESA